MSKELRENVADKLSYEYGVGGDNLAFANELINLILDEVKEAVNSCNKDVSDQCIWLDEAIKAIDNLRGSDD